MKISRRRLMQTAGAAALAPLPRGRGAAAMPAPRFEGPDTPKICLIAGDGGADAEAGAKRIKQLGVNHVIAGAGRIPWTEEELKGIIERYRG